MRSGHPQESPGVHKNGSHMTPAGLSRLLAESRHAPDGLVPVVGTGLNNETVRIEAADPDDDWASLVDGIAHGTGMTAAERAELQQSFLARWERLAIRWAQAHQLEPFQGGRSDVCEATSREGLTSRTVARRTAAPYAAVVEQP
jgi:hypothetical protein